MKVYQIRSIRPILVTLACTGAAVTALLLYVALLPMEATATSLQPPALACAPSAPCVAVVIDDIGRDPNMLRRFLALKLDLTFGVLPHAPHTEDARRAIRRVGREMILHLPMLPLDPSKISDEPVVLGRERPLRTALAECLARVPEAVGVNNHMGSALSQDRAAMGEIFSTLSAQGLWSLDSRTIDNSEICPVAAQRGVPCLKRDIFLDDPPTPDTVRLRWQEGVSIARSRGWAVMIGHPNQATLSMLRQGIKGSEVRIMRLSMAIKTESKN